LGLFFKFLVSVAYKLHLFLTSVIARFIRALVTLCAAIALVSNTNAMLKHLILLLGLFFGNAVCATNYKSLAADSAPNLELSFKLRDDGKRIGDYYLLIYCDTNAADTLFVKKGRVAYVHLKYNHNYTLRYVKEGYRDRIVIVRTDIASMKQSKDMEFDYQIELVKISEASNTIADLPVAVIKYDARKKKFDYSRKYHRQVRTKKNFR
jgi:hypothetical protein